MLEHMGKINDRELERLSLYDAGVGDHRRMREVLAELDSALNAEPNEVRLLPPRAHLRLLSGDGEGALRDYSAAIEWEQELAPHYFNRGLAHEELGRKDEARRDFSSLD